MGLYGLEVQTLMDNWRDTIKKEKFTQVNLPVKFISLSAESLDHSWELQNVMDFMVLGFKLLWTIGTRKRIFKPHPTQIFDSHSFVQISVGHQFSLALYSNEHVVMTSLLLLD
jgi:hypothetical protein